MRATSSLRQLAQRARSAAPHPAQSIGNSTALASSMASRTTSDTARQDSDLVLGDLTQTGSRATHGPARREGVAVDLARTTSAGEERSLALRGDEGDLHPRADPSA